MGALVGLLLGLGLFLIWRSFSAAAAATVARRADARERSPTLLAQAGIESVTPGAVSSRPASGVGARRCWS